MVLCVAIICVNTLVLVLYSKRRQLRTKTNTLLASLATSDLLMGLCGVPLFIACNAFLDGDVCIAQGVVFRFIAVSTMFHILAITGERYICVLHPMQYINIVTGKRILRVIACIWAIIAFCGRHSTVLGFTFWLFLRQRNKVHCVLGLQLGRISGLFCNTVFSNGRLLHQNVYHNSQTSSEDQKAKRESGLRDIFFKRSVILQAAASFHNLYPYAWSFCRVLDHVVYQYTANICQG